MSPPLAASNFKIGTGPCGGPARIGTPGLAVTREAVRNDRGGLAAILPGRPILASGLFEL